MKKIFNVILFALFCTSFAQAQGGKTFEFTYEGQTLEYEVANGNEAMVSKQQSAKISGDVKIPESVTFEGKKFRVTSIGVNAFFSCDKLTSVIIPNSVTTIGRGAFFACVSLKSINVVKDNLHYYSENGVLFDNTKKRLIQCPGGIKGNYVIPNGVTTIGETAFAYCKGLTSVTLPNSVTTIDKSAFGACGSLKSINVVKDNMHYCSENGVLFDITKKRLIQCPGGIKGNYAIPDGVTTIGAGAFMECKGLTSVTLPNCVTTIGAGAFMECKGLTSITIPNSVTSIGVYAFFNCNRLTSVTIPNSVTTIGERAFMECKGLTSVTIPNSVTTIGERAFWNCSGLISVTIPNSVTTIGDAAFWGCSGLTSVTIPNSVTTIGEEAFKYCTGLTILTIENATPPVVRVFAFGGISTIYVPAESVEKYKTAKGWSRYADKIKAIGK